MEITDYQSDLDDWVECLLNASVPRALIGPYSKSLCENMGPIYERPLTKHTLLELRIDEEFHKDLLRSFNERTGNFSLNKLFTT